MSLQSEMPQRMLNAAVAFYIAGARCDQPMPLAPGRAYFTGAPSVVCYAFSIELYLKLLILLSTGQEAAREHDLAKLYAALNETTRNAVIASYKFSGDPEMLAESVADCAKDFERWRYAHEHDFLLASTTTMDDIARALHGAARQIAPDLVSAYER